VVTVIALVKNGTRFTSARVKVVFPLPEGPAIRSTVPDIEAPVVILHSGSGISEEKDK
jgi:hypothetical protein